MFRAAVLTRHRVARVAFSLTLSREYFHGCVTVFLRILFSASPRLSPPLGSLLPLPAHHPGGGIWALAPPPACIPLFPWTARNPVWLESPHCQVSSLFQASLRRTWPFQVGTSCPWELTLLCLSPSGMVCPAECDGQSPLTPPRTSSPKLNTGA